MALAVPCGESDGGREQLALAGGSMIGLTEIAGGFFDSASGGRPTTQLKDALG